MKKSEAKIILNLNVEEDELNKKIEMAVEKYLDDAINRCLTEEKLRSAVEKYIDEVLLKKNWNGKTMLDDIVTLKVKPLLIEEIKEAVTDTVDKLLLR